MEHHWQFKGNFRNGGDANINSIDRDDGADYNNDLLMNEHLGLVIVLRALYLI